MESGRDQFPGTAYLQSVRKASVGLYEEMPNMNSRVCNSVF